jgi:hypothetical protein
MFRKGVMALFIVVATSAIIIGAFAISNINNSSNNIPSNQLTPLNTPLNNTSSANSNIAPANGNSSVPSVSNSVNNGKLSNTNGKVNTNRIVSLTTGTNNKNVPGSDSIGSNFKNNPTNHLSSVTIISPAEAQKIAAKYIEQAGATPGTPSLISQDGKKVYVVPVIIDNVNVGEIDVDAQSGSNLGGAGGVKI